MISFVAVTISTKETSGPGAGVTVSKRVTPGGGLGGDAPSEGRGQGWAAGSTGLTRDQGRTRTGRGDGVGL